MKSKKRVYMLIGILLIALLVGMGLISSLRMRKEQTEENESSNDLGQYSESDLFQAVPVMRRGDISYTKATDVGGGDFMITAIDTTLSDYQEYLLILEENGFQKLVDNGENGIEGFVYTSHYQKKGLLVIVSHIVNLKKTEITATDNTSLSEHLTYDDSYVAENRAEARTSFHLLEMKEVGNSFVFQLKNGHFILMDGGKEGEITYLLDYLEELAPENEKPVVEAWFISHAHLDHMGVFKAFAGNSDYAERIFVENVFFDLPSDEAVEIAGTYDSVNEILIYCKAVPQYLKQSDGSATNLYHPRLGERYYFNDLTIDMIYTMELLPPEEWDTWNATSTVMMLMIEEQKVMLTADTDWCSQLVYTEMYDKEYFDLDVYQVPHHGINVYKQIIHRLGNIKTAFWPTRAVGTVNSEGTFIGRKTQNEYMVSVVEEAISWENGTKVLTFPYVKGSAVTLPQKFGTEE